MKRTDIIIPFILIGVVAVSGVFFLNEWQTEQEELAMTQMAENLFNLDPKLTSCEELLTAKDKNEHVILESALDKKLKEMEC